MKGLRDAVIAAILLGAVMALGDWVWSALKLPHRVASGLTHGAVRLSTCAPGVWLRRVAGVARPW